ncbi:MAG: aldehyde dehydrogenase family protein, partial [Planctomycetia bacterium]
KNQFVLNEMGKILESLTRGLDLNVFARGYGEERGVPISYQCLTDALGLILPSNSPGVHTLWLPIIPLQVGLVLKPGSSEPWTPYRITEAFYQAGIPREAIGVYPGPRDVGGTILGSNLRALIFGDAKTVDQYRGNPNVQVHGPGFSKILLGDDQVDQWEKHADMMLESVFANSGRGCINTSAIFVSRHGREIADHLAKKLAEVKVLPHDHPEASLAAFTTKGVAEAVSKMIDQDLEEPGVVDYTAKHRDGSRLIQHERCDYLLPTVVFAPTPEAAVVKKEFMFPFVTVVECPQADMIEKMGPTLVCSAVTDDEPFRRRLLDALHIDRLNFGGIPTIRLNWLQPHEGNIVDFLYRPRAYQSIA